jgi:hypothetical protein
MAGSEGWERSVGASAPSGDRTDGGVAGVCAVRLRSLPRWAELAGLPAATPGSSRGCRPPRQGACGWAQGAAARGCRALGRRARSRRAGCALAASRARRIGLPPRENEGARRPRPGDVEGEIEEERAHLREPWPGAAHRKNWNRH